MSDAVDSRLVELVDLALGKGRSAVEGLLAESGIDGELRPLAAVAVDIALDKARDALLAAFAGSGRVDVEGDVPVDITIRD